MYCVYYCICFMPRYPTSNPAVLSTLSRPLGCFPAGEPFNGPVSLSSCQIEFSADLAYKITRETWRAGIALYTQHMPLCAHFRHSSLFYTPTWQSASQLKHIPRPHRQRYSNLTSRCYTLPNAWAMAYSTNQPGSRSLSASWYTPNPRSKTAAYVASYHALLRQGGTGHQTTSPRAAHGLGNHNHATSHFQCV
jgi:hypothetical protein